MNEKRIGVAAGIVSLLGLAVQHGPSIALDRWLGGAGVGRAELAGDDRESSARGSGVRPVPSRGVTAARIVRKPVPDRASAIPEY